jgi:hypothetical protein
MLHPGDSGVKGHRSGVNRDEARDYRADQARIGDAGEMP